MPRKLLVCYVLPSRYDDEGYVQRYWRNVLPSNTLACLKSLTCALAGTEELGRDVDLTVEIYDDSVQRVPIERIVRRARKSGAQLLVGLVGVQSNQFPRAADIALAFREHDVPVMIGGFHVSGVLALFGEPSPELQRMLEHGVTLVRGEAEAPGALAGILRDALDGALRPLYNITELPDLSHAAVPQQDEEYLKRFVWKNMGTIDTSRGCPFNCSFCTIINVQGRTMRFRSAEAILKSIEENHAHGVNVYFFTDDNFARSAIWETLFDGMIALRAQGIVLRFMMQVDTQAWRIPHFIEKAQAAGCYLVFIGMETLNPKNIAAAGKRQNKVGQYAAMVEAWHQADILVEVGYIIGFPHDTVESVRRDITMLQHEIKVDEAAFFMLTPLPGSRDHFNMVQQGTPLDADLNNYDSFHETFRHARIPAGQWYGLYREAWETFYSKDNIVNMMLRVPPALYWRTLWLCIWNRYATLFGTHPMVTGFLRLKDRKGRRPTFAA
ncbi:MAG: radical SAM protein, partial [Candidatus Hydrogenedentes bacterium]|nr:radical SAM protein [Candidatus Hydrogenedentota bacterium]